MEVAIFGFSEIKDKIKVPAGLNLESDLSSRWMSDFDVVIGNVMDMRIKSHNFNEVIDLIKSDGLMICFIDDRLLFADGLLNSIKLMEEGNADLAQNVWNGLITLVKYFNLSLSQGKTIRPTPSAGILSNIITKLVGTITILELIQITP